MRHTNKGIKYNCDHTTDGTIIMNTSSLAFSAYMTWAETTGKNNKECFPCFLKRKIENQTD